MKISTKITISSISLFFIANIYFAGFYDTGAFKEEFDKFYLADLNGQINSITHIKGGATFSLIGNKTEYKFYPHPISNVKTNEGEEFAYIARKNDALRKKAKSDTLTLLKDGRVFYFTFDKSNSMN